MREKFPDKYPNQQAVADAFHISRQLASFLIIHYEFIEKIKGKLPPSSATRVAQEALADKFQLSLGHANELIKHYEFIEDVKSRLPPNMVPRGTMLPETMIREIRRVPEDLQPKLVRAVLHEG